MRNLPVAVVALAMFTGSAALAQTSALLLGPTDSVAHVFRGERSGYADAARLVIRDATAWRQVWATLAMGRPDSVRPADVDFRTEMVIVAAYGARPFSGARIAIDSVFRQDVAIYAVVRSVAGSMCNATPTVVQPVDVVRVPRSERPIAFIERSTTAACPAK